MMEELKGMSELTAFHWSDIFMPLEKLLNTLKGIIDYTAN
jgi:hypothetical protein